MGITRPMFSAALSTFAILFVRLLGGEATVFTLVNECEHTVWPGILPGQGMGEGGFALEPSEKQTLNPPPNWSGRLWGRTGCTFDNSGQGSCLTGNCGNALNCNNAGGDPPVSLIEFTLGEPNDFYDVSLVDGFNLPVSAVPTNGYGNCSIAGNCYGDLRDSCPTELAVRVAGEVVACRSACEAFNSPEYCCTGAFGNPNTCLPTVYSLVFKKMCPTAYSYAYDDPSSIFTCSGADYTITFCPSGSRLNPFKKGCELHTNEPACNNAIGSTQFLHEVFISQFVYIVITLYILRHNDLNLF